MTTTETTPIRTTGEPGATVHVEDAVRGVEPSGTSPLQAVRFCPPGVDRGALTGVLVALCIEGAAVLVVLHGL